MEPSQRPKRTRARDQLFSTDGKSVFYFRQRTEFDLSSFSFASTDCPVWEDVVAWDKNDVYTLSPQSCGGANCGGDYTGYYWHGLGVLNPTAYRWISGGYGADDSAVYHLRFGNLEGVRPEDFEVLTCSDGQEDFVIARAGERLYRHGRRLNAEEALELGQPKE